MPLIEEGSSLHKELGSERFVNTVLGRHRITLAFPKHGNPLMLADLSALLTAQLEVRGNRPDDPLRVLENLINRLGSSSHQPEEFRNRALTSQQMARLIGPTLIGLYNAAINHSDFELTSSLSSLITSCGGQLSVNGKTVGPSVILR